MFGPDPAAIASVPRFQWLPDGKLLLFDNRKAGSTFEILDAQTGVRTQALDRAQALRSLQAAIGPGDTIGSLPWPIALDDEGTRALYEFYSDLFILEIRTATFTRITHTAQEEKAATISPDGRFVGFVRDNNLYAVELERKTERCLTADGSDSLLNGVCSWVYWEEIFGHRAAAYWWSEDSKSIAFLRTDESGVGQISFTDFRPYQPRVLKQRYPQAGQRNPKVKLGIAKPGGGTTVWMNLPDSAYEYITRVNWVPGSRSVSVQTMNRAQDRVTLYMVDRTDGRATSILRETDDAWLHIYDPVFLQNGKEFLWLSERTGFAHVYRYTIDGRLLNAVTAGEWSVRPFGALAIYEEAAIRAVDEKEGWVYVTAGEKSTVERHLYRVNPGGGVLHRLSGEHGYHRPTFSRDRQWYLDTYSNVSTPPSLSLHRADGTKILELAPPRIDLLKGLDMQYPAFFSIPMADGLPLPAQVSKPADFDPAKKYPAIVYVYGGPSSPSVSDDWNGNDWAESIYFDQVLLRNGYVVFSVENRASAAISKALERTIKGNMYGRVELNDLLTAVGWICRQMYVDSTRIGIWGWSGGGTYTLLALTRSPAFKAGISVAPVTDWHYYDTKWAELSMKLPGQNPGGYQATSVVESAANLHGKLLLVYSTFDDNVHPQNSQAFVDALVSAGKPVQMMVYPMRKHNIDDAPAKIHLYTTMLRFWKESL
jgi:dipeptidyl-peptidase-4